MPFQSLTPDVFLWSDLCNVYVIRSGNAAVLIDLGNGSVLDHLHEIGVKKVEHVLFTHHHREQCQGGERLKELGAEVACSEIERPLFENPTAWRKMKPTLNDQFSVYGSSYVRPPVTPIKIDRTFKSMDDFSWRGREFWCLDTRGNSPGGMSFVLREGERWLAFCGDVMVDGARMHNYFDHEWDYGFAAGIYATFGAASLLKGFSPAWLCPSHGPIIKNAQEQLTAYQEKLRKLGKLLVRGYDLNTFATGDQDTVSRPTSVPHVWQLTPHLYKFRGPNFWPNFEILIADSGKGLIIDCGLFDPQFLVTAIERMHERLGLKKIEALIVTHMHGDHMLEAPLIREKFGAELWTMQGIEDKCQQPEHYDLVAPIQSYGKPIESVQFDRTFAAGESFEWEGYQFTIDWMPGQTKYACCIHGEIDGRRVAFTGDNLFASTTDPKQDGHECVVARNACILEEGYLYAASYLHTIGPDLICGGHSWVLDRPMPLIARYRAWALEMREAFRALSTDPDYRYMFDPFWVRVAPYRVVIEPGESSQALLMVRNFRERSQAHRIEFVCPPGIRVEPSAIEGTTGSETTSGTNVTIHVDKTAAPGVNLVAMDVTLDGKRYGQWFDYIVHVGPWKPEQGGGEAAPANSNKKGQY